MISDRKWLPLPLGFFLDKSTRYCCTSLAVSAFSKNAGHSCKTPVYMRATQSCTVIMVYR